jgi:hypothetical protein
MNITWTEAILSLGIGVGLAAAAGFRVFIPLLMLGIAARAHLLNLNDGFAWLGSVPAIAAFSIATLVEIGAYYIPAIDNFLDFLAGPLAVVSGVLAAAAVITDMPPLLRWFLVVVAGGGTAGVVQGVTSIVRLKSTVFTAGLGNFVIATVEWIGSLIASIVAILAPIFAMILTGIFLILVIVAGSRIKITGMDQSD